MSTDTTPGVLGIDPFAALDQGAYRDHQVEVRAAGPLPARRELHMVRTEHFDVTHRGELVSVTHRVPAEQIDDNLSGLLADELFTPGWLRGSELFERLFTGVVLSHGPDPVAAWARFYRQSLQLVDGYLGQTTSGGHGTLADYAGVYAAAERSLATGDVMELGCCFGFLSLRLAGAGRSVLAIDLSPGTLAVLDAVAPHVGPPLTTLVADAAHVPIPDHSMDNVLAIHLLEHLDAEHGARVLAEALRVARRRVVIAVPLEDVADQTWGHVRTISLADLDEWGARTGLPYQVWEEHGGWLTVDVGDASPL